jgi:hypothetical protein
MLQWGIGSSGERQWQAERGALPTAETPKVQPHLSELLVSCLRQHTIGKVYCI